jgi:hypothetical protein
MTARNWTVQGAADLLRRWLLRPQDIAGAAAAGGDPTPLLTEAAIEHGAFGEMHVDPNA